MNTLRTAAAALIAALSLGTAAQAQDFTGMDLNALNNQMWGQMQGQMDTRLNGIISQNVNDPQVVQMYHQYRANGYQGSLEQFAYDYAANGGFTREGILNNYQVTQDINRRDQGNWNNYVNSQGAYADAYNGYTTGFSNNMQESGLGLMGQSTYNGAYGSQQLPHTWGAGTSHYYGGNDYQVDQSGNYWMADPNGSGFWSEMGW
jgi:hypothetical protein